MRDPTTAYGLSREKDGLLTYRYGVNGEWTLETHLLEEVKEPHQAWFQATLDEFGWDVETRSLAGPPWRGDFSGSGA